MPITFQVASHLLGTLQVLFFMSDYLRKELQSFLCSFEIDQVCPSKDILLVELVIWIFVDSQDCGLGFKWGCIVAGIILQRSLFQWTWLIHSEFYLPRWIEILCVGGKLL